jgi:hypothetical protein
MLRVIDGKKGALAYLRQLASSKKWQERIGVAAHETTDETDEATAKQNAELQKLYADPKWQAKMALNSSISFAADCVVSWFLNYDAGLAPMSITRKVLLAKFQRTAKEWRNRNVRSKTLGRNGKEGRLEASDAEVRRKHAARAIMHAMASDAAWARLDGEKTWAEDRYREWRGLLLEHSEDVERWEDFNPADWDYDGIGVSVRLAGQTFPNCKVTANPGSTKAGRFYLEVCGWLDEFFADERVWNAVQTLAADFRKRGEMKPNNIPKILDGKDHTNAYLDQLALSTEWWKRIGAASTAPIDWMGIMQR